MKLAAKRAVRQVKKMKKVFGKNKNCGQASVEFVLVATVIMIIVTTIALLVHMAADGDLAKIINTHASHDISNIEGLLDVAIY